MRLSRMILSVLMLLTVAIATYAQDKVRVVAIVNGVELSVADLNQEVQKILPSETTFHSGVSAEKMKVVEAKALAALVDKELQYQDGLAKGLKLSKQELAEELDKLAKNFSSKAEFTKAQQGAGFTEKTMASFVERNIVAEKISLREVDEKIRITDEILKAYYEKNRARFFKPEEFRASQIMVKVDPAATAEEKGKLKERAAQILKKLKAGADFATLAAAESDDASRIKGGDLGYFHVGRTIPEFEATVKTLKVGEVSGVVETIYGFHIIKLTEKKEPRQLSFEEMKDKLKGQLSAEERSRLSGEWMAGLKAKAKIVYPESR